MADNKVHQRLRKSAKEPSLLAGLLFDNKNNPMSPTHATKNNRRYRYYISQAILQYREQEAGSVIRIAAQLIEDITIRQIKKFLKNSNQLLSVIALDQPSAMDQQAMISRANVLETTWDDQSPQGRLVSYKNGSA